jgi:hypothetical protein
MFVAQFAINSASCKYRMSPNGPKRDKEPKELLGEMKGTGS